MPKATALFNEFESYTFKTIATHRGGQWVNGNPCYFQDVERKVEAKEDEDMEEDEKKEEDVSEPMEDTRKVQVEESETRPEGKKRKEERKYSAVPL